MAVRADKLQVFRSFKLLNVLCFCAQMEKRETCRVGLVRPPSLILHLRNY
jgi:hypothetical protein